MAFLGAAYHSEPAMSPQKVALVVGASRGLGLEFVSQLLSRPGCRVVAACRNPTNATQLQQLRSQHPDKLSVVMLDSTNEESIQAAAVEVSRQHQHLDLLLNVAGVLHIPDVMSPETALARVTAENLMRVFQTNAFGPILVSKAFTPLLVKAAEANAATSERPAVIANLSARVGSIGDNRLGGWYSYRASKTALNQLTKTMSLEFARRKQPVSCILLHPGTCDTGLSAPFQKNVQPAKLFTRERAVQQLLQIIDRTTCKENGKFFAWDGQEVPW
ncbi:hypothetical protein WJX72_000975 [[Myrmecia] bisecta]|uniref:Uncharacterized protein n=1 Tax=[Myrmecia] bisecta TaxID=41462 RepID=A0AAW1PNV2_9CHLO